MCCVVGVVVLEMVFYCILPIKSIKRSLPELFSLFMSIKPHCVNQREHANTVALRRGEISEQNA